MGFSAGGFLTRSVIANAGNEMPAFAAPIYPNMAAMDVPANAPPIFVLIASDDFLLERGGLGLVQSWRTAKKPIEFHLLANGGHGFGLGRPGTSTQDWMELLYRWLEVNGAADGKVTQPACYVEFSALRASRRAGELARSAPNGRAAHPRCMWVRP